jgi:hypothetical protein
MAAMPTDSCRIIDNLGPHGYCRAASAEGVALVETVRDQGWRGITGGNATSLVAVDRRSDRRALVAHR